jgi:hypothetical protein
MMWPRARIRPVSAILVLAVLVLGLLVTARERREARLRLALAKFQNRAHQDIYSSLDSPVSAPGTSAAVPLNWGVGLRLVQRSTRSRSW